MLLWDRLVLLSILTPQPWCAAQTLRNWAAAPLQPPYALQLYNPVYQYAAAPLNWVPAWVGRGAIYGNVTAVRAPLARLHQAPCPRNKSSRLPAEACMAAPRIA